MTGLIRDAYDLTRDTFILGALGAEYGYWTVRTWGMSHQDIKATVAVGAFAIAAFTLPESRASAALAIYGPWGWVWRYRERWLHMARVIFLMVMLVQGFRVLFTAAPVFFFPGQAQVQSSERELAIHGAQIDALQKRLEKMDDQKVGERLALVEESVKTTGQVSTFCALGILGWIIREVLSAIKGKRIEPDGD